MLLSDSESEWDKDREAIFHWAKIIVIIQELLHESESSMGGFPPL